MKARKGAWVYHDTRRLKTDFVMMSNASIERAMEIKSRSTYRLWLYILSQVNGRTLERNPEGWILGESQLRERTGISRTALYDGMLELTTLGLIAREKVGRTTHAFLQVASSQSDATEDSSSPDASSQSDASTAAGTPKKTGNSEPVKKPQCVQPVGLLPIHRNNSNSLNLSGRETAKEAKNGEIPEEFKAIVLDELNAAYKHWLNENRDPAASSALDVPERAWTSLLYLLKKKGGMDGLHRKGYPMGRTRKKGQLLEWFEVVSLGWTPTQVLFGTPWKRTYPDLVTKYRSCWTEMFQRFGYTYHPEKSSHLKHSIGPAVESWQSNYSAGHQGDKEAAIERWDDMTGPERMSILDEKMELAIAEYGQEWFERGEY